MADSAGFIVVFDNIGNKAEISHFCLCLKTATLIVIRGNFLTVIPAFFGSSENGFVKIEHGRKIAIISDKIWKFFIFCIENLPYGKCIVRLKGAIPHFS